MPKAEYHVVGQRRLGRVDVISTTPRTPSWCRASIPWRREVGRLGPRRLITDGRIHPGRSRKWWTRRARVDASVLEAVSRRVRYRHQGHAPELWWTVGSDLRYRTCTGLKPLLEHSKEVPGSRVFIAAELKLGRPAREAWALLLHDIVEGAHEPRSHDGTHLQLGVECRTKHGGAPDGHSTACGLHHDDVAHESPISVIVQAADAVSGSRPGRAAWRRDVTSAAHPAGADRGELRGRGKGVRIQAAGGAGRRDPNADRDAKRASLRADRPEDEARAPVPGQIKGCDPQTRAVGFCPLGSSRPPLGMPARRAPGRDPPARRARDHPGVAAVWWGTTRRRPRTSA